VFWAGVIWVLISGSALRFGVFRFSVLGCFGLFGVFLIFVVLGNLFVFGVFSGIPRCLGLV